MVEFDYFEKLNQECRELIVKYKQKDYWKECHSLKGEEILYEVRPKSFRIPQHLGRYDNFFYWSFHGKPYKPGKLITEAPSKHEYWKYHLVKGNLLYVEFYQIWEKQKPKPVADIYVPIGDGYIQVDKKNLNNLFVIQDKGDYMRYVSATPQGPLYLEENEPQLINEYIVSKDKKHFDYYQRAGFCYCHSIFELGEDNSHYFQVTEDSKYLKKDYASWKAKPGKEHIVQRFQTSISHQIEVLLSIGFKQI